MGHIYEMNEKVSMREFVGGSARKQKVTELMSLSRKIEKEKDPKKKSLMLDQWDAKANVLSNLEEDLSGGIQELIDTELSDAPADVQTEVFEILDARMRQKGAHGIVDTVRNVNYIFSMGNFLSAITQLGDIPIVFYRYGVNGDTLKSVGEAFKNVANVARGKEGTALVEAMDFTNALREFSSGDKISAKALETVFKYSGLKYVDLIGKEASMRASLKYYQNPKNKAEFLSKYENFFEDAGAVYSKLQLGNTADMDVKTVLISELAEYQPVTMSQQSKAYLKGGNLRAFYALKTFTLRTTSAAIREGLVDINKGGAKNIAKGTTRMAGILFIYALAGAGADELKDLARGKTSSITDNTVDNMLQMLFISKYSLEKGMQEGAPIKSFMSNLLPPIRYADNFLTDVYSLASDEKDFKYKSLQTVPFIGSIAFGQSPVGQEQDLKNQRDDILKKVRENAKSRKGARDGLTDDIRKYNRSVSGDQRIGNDAVRRAFKEGRSGN